MLSYLAKCREELDNIELSADMLLRLEEEQIKLESLAFAKARQLSAARVTAAEELRIRIEEELSQLDMPKVRFCVEILPKEGAFPLDQSGMDQVQFLLSANVGEKQKPIQKVASGGELARIMLAVKSALADRDDVPTVIYDEIDTGISGMAAGRVGRLLRDTAADGRQVICVTHTAQIAAFAQRHLLIEKHVAEGRTYTGIRPLGEEDSVRELARIISGDKVTDTALANAREMRGIRANA
jgi:DNA repair protein RecN (Recombination protein N)